MVGHEHQREIMQYGGAGGMKVIGASASIPVPETSLLQSTPQSAILARLSPDHRSRLNARPNTTNRNNRREV